MSAKEKKAEAVVPVEQAEGVVVEAETIKSTEEVAEAKAPTKANVAKSAAASRNTKKTLSRDVLPDKIDRGNISQYELAVLYHPDLEIDLDKAEKRVLGLIGEGSGKVTNTDNWGKRKLAYPIKKQEHAVYVFYTFEMPGINVAKLEQTLNITDEVIRFMVTKPNLKAAAKAEALKAEKARKAAERGEAGKDEESEDKEDQE